MDNDTTIEAVVKKGLCTGCGTCVGICPLDAIEMTVDHLRGIYVPALDREECNECGMCVDVCPGHNVDFRQLNLEIFGKEPGDILLGNYLNCYTGYAADYDIRYNSASGGLVTALLIFALEEGLIDGALVTKMRDDRPLEPEPFIARTREEIISAARSKYCPVPANIAVKEILKAREGERFAVVGLPCHIHGIRNAERVNKTLAERIVLHVGLFCAHTDTFALAELVLQKHRIDKEHVASFDYRGCGWPGSMTIHTNDGMKISVPFAQFVVWHSRWCFIPEYCTFCCDALAELADISFGDAWLRGLKSDRAGQSVIVTRNEIAERVLEQLLSMGVVSAENTSAVRVAQSQIGLLYSKKKSLRARIGLFHKNAPYPVYAMDSGVIDYLYTIYQHYDYSLISARPFARRALEFIPVEVIRFLNLPQYVISKAQMSRVIRERY